MLNKTKITDVTIKLFFFLEKNTFKTIEHTAIQINSSFPTILYQIKLLEKIKLIEIKKEGRKLKIIKTKSFNFNNLMLEKKKQMLL